MKQKLFFLFFTLFFIKNSKAQNDTFYLLIENPHFIQYEKRILTSFGVKSKDKKFFLDTFVFEIQSFRGWDDDGKDIYLSLDELRKKVDISTVKYQTVLSFSKNKKWWEIHNELSLKEKIYLIEKKRTGYDYSLKRYKYTYYIIPMRYKYTSKNLVFMNTTFRKNSK